jgi:hypothetical protein
VAESGWKRVSLPYRLVFWLRFYYGRVFYNVGIWPREENWVGVLNIDYAVLYWTYFAIKRLPMLRYRARRYDLDTR